MTPSTAAVVLIALAVHTGQASQARGVSAETEARRQADRAAIETLHQRDIAATVSRDPVAMTALWTDDAVRLSPGQPAEVGKEAIRESHERWATGSVAAVLSYVPDPKDLTILGDWAVEWGYFTCSYVDRPSGEAKEIRGTVLMVLKKSPDGSWKYFRRMGDTLFSFAGPPMLQGPVAPTGSNRGRAEDLAGIEKVQRLDIAATVGRDPVALTDLWTDDAVRLAIGRPAEVGKQAIQQSNERGVRARPSLEVLSYVPKTQDLTFLDDGWAVEWRSFTASIVESPGGEPKEIRGTVLGVLKRLPDGSWKAFRGMGM